MLAAGGDADLWGMAAKTGRPRVFGRIAVILASAVAAAFGGSARATTYAWGISKSVSDSGDRSFALAPGASRIVDYRLLVITAISGFGPADGSETATLTDVLTCPTGFTCTRIGATGFPMIVSVSNGMSRTIAYSVLVTNVSAPCGTSASLLNTATVTPNGGTRPAETRTHTATISTPACVPLPTIKGPGDITVNATSSTGARVPFRVMATGGTPICRTGGGSLVASGSLFPIGTTTVTCTVTNTVGTASTSFVVRVRGAYEQLSDLLALGLPQSLRVKLEHALGHMHAGQLRTACNVLRAFKREARVQAGHQLPMSQAGPVIAAVGRIYTVAGCSRLRN